MREDKICVTDFLKKFESEIYKYTKHSHRARWQDLQFKHSHEIFSAGTILSVVDFAENYTFAAQKIIKVNTIILTKFRYLSMLYIDILNKILMALKSRVTIEM